MTDAPHLALPVPPAPAPAPAESALLAEARARSAADGVLVPPADCIGLLQALALALPARRVFEIGTGYGVSALALALAAPVDHLFTVERRAERAAVARAFFARTGRASAVSVMVGEGARLVHKVAGPFDLVVRHGPAPAAVTIDRLVALLRPGGILVSVEQPDDPAHPDASAARLAIAERLGADPRLFTTVLPLGAGLILSVRTEHEA